MRAPDYSDGELTAALVEAAAALGEPLTAAGYDGWQRAHDAASPALLIRRFGSWNEACARAGVATNKTRSHSRKWTNQEVVDIVAVYLADPATTGTFADYTAWAREQPGAPSGATLRQRFGWAEVKRRAAGAS